MAFNYEYPYVDPNRYNADWLLNRIKEYDETIKNFILVNEIHYHDPISWDKATRYDKSTVVYAPNGDTLLSKKEVPAGIEYTDTRYWFVLAHYNALFELYNRNVLEYKATVDAYKTEVDFLNNYLTPYMFGAVGDGVTDDTQAIIDCNAAAIEQSKPMLMLGNFYTTEACTLRMCKNILQIGIVTYLHLQQNATKAEVCNISLDKVTTLILQDFKRSTFTVGKIETLMITGNDNDKIGDSTAFAYNNFFGAEIDTLNITTGVNATWVNENNFYGIRMKSVTISGSYHHNNNRFYDVTLESGVINLDGCFSNYFRIRAEGGYTLNKTNDPKNNVIVRTYSIDRAMRWMNGDLKSENGNIQIMEPYMFMESRKLVDSNVYNGRWSSAHNFTTMKANAPNNKSFVPVMVIPLENDIGFRFESDVSSFRIYVYLLDENMSVIEDDLTNIAVDQTNLPFSTSSHYYGTTSNKSSVIFSLLKNDRVKYVRINVSSGSTSSDYTYIKGWAYSVAPIDVISDDYRGLASESMPTGGTDIPTGLFVKNIGSTAGTIKGWIYNGSEWIAQNV